MYRCSAGGSWTRGAARRNAALQRPGARGNQVKSDPRGRRGGRRRERRWRWWIGVSLAFRKGFPLCCVGVGLYCAADSTCPPFVFSRLWLSGLISIFRWCCRPRLSFFLSLFLSLSRYLLVLLSSSLSACFPSPPSLTSHRSSARCLRNGASRDETSSAFGLTQYAPAPAGAICTLLDLHCPAASLLDRAGLAGCETGRLDWRSRFSSCKQWSGLVRSWSGVARGP